MLRFQFGVEQNHSCFLLFRIFSDFLTSSLLLISRVNDDATQRRQLLQEFGRDTEATPESFRVVPENIHFEQNYWVNQRYVHTVTQ
jgi:hypothetical protein